MKIIFSRRVAAESQLVGQRICAALDMPFIDAPLDDRLEEAERVTAQLRNISVRCVEDEVIYEVSDTIVLMFLRWYGRIADNVVAIINIAKPLFRASSDELTEIMECVGEQK